MSSDYVFDTTLRLDGPFAAARYLASMMLPRLYEADIYKAQRRLFCAVDGDDLHELREAVLGAQAVYARSERWTRWSKALLEALKEGVHE